MARIKLSGIVNQISGKFEGAIFGKSSSGNYLKSNSFSQQKLKPSNSKTRMKIKEVTQLWKNTTPTQKAAWQAETVNYPQLNNFGETVYFNGYQLFNKLNTGYLNIGSSISYDVPTFGNVVIGTSVSITAYTGYQIYNFSGVINGHYMKIYASKSLPNGIQPKLSDFRLLGVWQLYSTSGGQGISSAYLNAFGAPIAGNIIYGYHETINPVNGYTSQKSNFGSGVVL